MGLLLLVNAELDEKSFGSEVIFETHQLVKSWLKSLALINISCILATFETSQFPMS